MCSQWIFLVSIGRSMPKPTCNRFKLLKVKNQDIRKTEIVKVYGIRWRFLFRENGYVIIQTISSKASKKIEWVTQLHGISVDACLQYIWTANGSKGEPLQYENLEKV